MGTDGERSQTGGQVKLFTIRAISGLFFATSRFFGLTPYEFFGIAFWIGFVLHLIAAEVWIQWARL